MTNNAEALTRLDARQVDDVAGGVPDTGGGVGFTPDELARWAVINMLPPEMADRAKGIEARVKAIVLAERAALAKARGE